ncbi:MAG: ArsR/SmtB family transcription factor [Lactovum sp.]
MKKEVNCENTVIHKEIVDYVKEQMYPEEEIVEMANFFKLLGDKTRMKILSVLDQHEMCVCDIAILLDMTMSAVSHQLALLRKSNIIGRRKEGKTVYYSLKDKHIHDLLMIELTHINEEEEEKCDDE